MSKLFKFIFYFTLFNIAFYKPNQIFTFDKEDGIMYITEFNYDKALLLFNNLVVFFYFTESKNCMNGLSIFKKAILKLKDKNITFAKIKISENNNISYKTLLEGFPTIKIFVNGTTILYDRELKEDDLVKFILKKTGRATTKLNTIKESEKFINENNVSIVYFGNDLNLIKLYTKLAENIIEFQFAISTKNEVIKKYKAENESLVIFKKFDDKRNDLKNINNEKEMESFILNHTKSNILSFNEQAVHLIFNLKKPGLILYVDPQSEKYEYYRELIYNVSKHFIINNNQTVEILFVITDSIDEYVERISEYIEVDIKKEIPSVKIVDLSVVYRKYYMEGEINEENIIKFINDWKNKKLKPILSSEDEPEKNDGLVYKLVGTTFESEVINKDNDVLVNFYATWEDNFKNYKLNFYYLAEKVKNNKKLVIAEMDGTKNEVECLRLDGFPTVKFYPAGKKNNPIDYEGKPNVKDLLKFINQHATYPISIAENRK